MEAQELYDWAIENNINNWRTTMILKINEEKIKSLDKKQMEAIEWFCKIIMSEKFYNCHDPVIRISSFTEMLDRFKLIHRGTKVVS